MDYIKSKHNKIVLSHKLFLKYKKVIVQTYRSKFPSVAMILAGTLSVPTIFSKLCYRKNRKKRS